MPQHTYKYGYASEAIKPSKKKKISRTESTKMLLSLHRGQ
jgi:hypothetical protein